MNKNRKFIKHMLPFAALVVGSFIGLAQFRTVNYTHIRENPVVFKEQLVKMGVNEDDYQVKTTESLEDHYKKVMSKVDIEKWENIRGPRPWENSREIQEQMRNKKKDKNNDEKD